MTEITETPNMNEQGAAQQQVQSQDTPTVTESQIVSETLSGLEDFITPETKAEINKHLSVEKKPEAEKKPEVQDSGNTEKKPESEKKPEGDEGDKGQKSVFGFNKKKEAKPAQISIENPDQIIEVVKSQFGVEVKDIKELPKFFESVQKWRGDSQKLTKAEKEANDFKSVLEGLPSNFIDAIKAYYKQEDYTKYISQKPKFDYSKSAEEQDVKTLVNHYFPNEFEDADFNEEIKSKTLEIATKAAIDKFETERQKHNETLAKKTQDAQKQLEAINASVSASVDSLKQDFPDVEQDALSEVTEMLSGGPEKVFEFFFNSDKTVKPSAAAALMMAKYGKEEMKRMMDIAARQTETRINEDLLTRGADGPLPKKSSVNQSQIPKEIMDQIEEIKQIKKQSTY